MPELPLRSSSGSTPPPAHLRADFGCPRQAHGCGVYLDGRLADGGRKSIAPLAARLAHRRTFDVSDPEKALQQFVPQSPWDE